MWSYLYKILSRQNEPRHKKNKKISNDQELIQSDPTPALKTKREKTK